MDLFHETLIEKNNPLAPGLLDISKKREISFQKRLKSLLVHGHVRVWADRMALKHKSKTGRDYIVYGHQPVDFITALMSLRYGMDDKQWPTEFTRDDVMRAFAWEGGRIPAHIIHGERLYYPLIAGGSEFTDYFEAQIGNGLFRTGMTILTAWSTGLGTPAVGDVIKATVWNDTVFECVVSGAVGGTEPTWNTGIGSETVDGGATWQANKIGVLKRSHFVALYTAAPGETGGGTEATYTGYARIQVTPTDANWTVSTQAAGAGRNDNVLSITFGSPTSGPETLTDFSIMSRLTGGNIHMFSPLTAAKTVTNGGPAPLFPVGALDVDIA